MRKEQPLSIKSFLRTMRTVVRALLHAEYRNVYWTHGIYTQRIDVYAKNKNGVVCIFYIKEAAIDDGLTRSEMLAQLHASAQTVDIDLLTCIEKYLDYRSTV